MANINVKKVEEINELISKAEIENTRNSVIIENIEKEWIEKYGTSEISEIKNKLDELNSDLQKSEERLNKIYSELLESQNWEELEEELN